MTMTNRPSSSSTTSAAQNPIESNHFLSDYPDEDSPSYPPVSTKKHPLPLQADVQFHISSDEHEEEEEEGEPITPFSLDLNSPFSIPIQRVSSEDELNFYVKRKRAKFIGPYLFGDIIGQGSYAKVKECLDRRNLCRRAVKIMQRRRLRKTPHGEKMALTEIRLLKKLQHPNVIRLYDFLRNDEKQKLYLFIDLCVVSLQEMLDNDQRSNRPSKVFPIWQAHGYFVQLINGLEYLHSKFIIHNDIKPGNLLITVDHQLKISDFGTAEQLDMFSPDDTIKRSQGTPAFQCPEIANGDDAYSGYSIDIWSCGVTLYNLVTGCLPFEADNIYLLFQTIGKGVYTIPDDIEPSLRSLIDGLLHIDKRLRLKIDEIKEHEWFRRRPPRTFEFVPFPPLALARFQTCTMYDYLSELHQSTPLAENSNEEQIIDRPDDFRISEDIQPVLQVPPPQQTRVQNGRSTLNCSCSRTVSGDNIQQMKRRKQTEARICSLS